MTALHNDLALAVLVLGWLCVVLAGCGAAYAVASAAWVRAFMARPAAVARGFPSVTILKPLHGDECGLLENLEDFCTQDYPGPVQLLFGVQCAKDPAIGVVDRLKRRHPGARIELVVDGRLYGSNRKVSNLLNMLPRAVNEVIVLSDSDIGVRGDYLRTVVATLDQPGVGVVSCLYTGRGEGSLWSRLSALGVNHHFLPNAVAGMTLGLASPCFGATIAMRREVLEEIGGLAMFSSRLADDYEIGREVRRRGYRLATPPMAVTHRCAEATARELIDHELRWARTIRLIDGPGFAGSIVTHPLPLAILGVALTHVAPAAATLALALAARLLLAEAVARATGAQRESWPLLILRDLLSFAVFVASFFVASVCWRGQSFRIEPDGLLIPIEEN